MDDQSLKILFGTAERSAELHVIRLTEELRGKIGKKDLKVYAVGSKKRLIKTETNIIVPDYFDIRGKALVGIFESFFYWFSGFFRWLLVYLKIGKFLKEHGKPDLFIAITSFFTNYFIGRKLQKSGVRCIYLMPPQIWAWGLWRLGLIKKVFEEVMTNFTFEVPFYQKGIEKIIHYGYPKPLYDSRFGTDDAIKHYRDRFNIPVDKRVLLLLPGSRRSEIKRLLPIFLKAAKTYLDKYRETHIHIINLPEHQETIEKILKKAISTLFDKNEKQITINFQEDEDSYSYITGIKMSDFVVCASGTVTVDAMILQKPMIICYKLNRLTYWAGWVFATNFIKRIGCFGLPNIYCLAEGLRVTPLIPELIQKKLSAVSLCNAMMELFSDDGKLKMQRKWLDYISKSMPNKNYYKQVSNYILSNIEYGKLEAREDGRYDKIETNNELYLYNLSNIYDIGSYNQRMVLIKIINRSKSGICILSQYPLPLGRELICSIVNRSIDSEVSPKNQLEKIKFIWFKKEGGNKYILGGERKIIKE